MVIINAMRLYLQVDLVEKNHLSTMYSPAVLLLLLLSAFGQGLVSASNGKAEDPCYRTCVEGETKTCTYDWSVGEYVTMRPDHCANCAIQEGTLGDVANCQVSGCIPGGGRVRIVAAVNQKVPGPKIDVCEGDRLIIKVTNIFPSESIIIHWHGTHQRGSQYMDGAPYLTQCPILPYASFTYDFIADTPGTHMWHAHIGHEEADGVFGTMVVRRPAAKEPQSSLYDEDLSEHSMIIWHWFGRAVSEIFPKAMYTGSSTAGEGLIINGLGGMEAFAGVPGDDTFNIIPRERFTVEAGKKYRFRVIYNTAIPCPIQVSVDNHELLAIASDSSGFKPIDVDAIFLNGGERYDFVLNANQTAGNYWIRVRGLGGCAGLTRVHQEAVLHYSTAELALPAGSPTYNEAIIDGRLLNPIGEITYNYSSSEIVYVSELENVDLEHSQDVSGEPNQTIYVEFKSNRYASQDIYGMWPQVNSRTFSFPPIALLPQRNEITRDLYCTDEDVCEPGTFCSCPYIYDIKLGELVEMVFVDVGKNGGDHPYHLHGYHYHVVAEDVVETGNSVDYVKSLNEQNKITKNFNGPLKDTVSVPSSGYAVIRFVADNPGFWFFHCHISHHADLGMGFVLKVGDVTEMPETPEGFLRCGNWSPTSDA